jgi:hypothetical protein
MSNDKFLDGLMCSICLNLCEVPVETNCCHNLLCKQCVISQTNCPLCRKKLKYTESILAKRLIDSIPTKCEYCNYETTRGEMNTHKSKCELMKFECPVCKVKFAKNKLILHLNEMHSNLVSKHFEQIIDVFKETSNTTEVVNKHVTIDKLVNRFGKVARLGSTGKYYCGGNLDGPRCKCCDGYCGPESGCNCSGCIELDIKARNLPKGWLVNREGFVCRKGEQNRFYCGRKVLISVQGCDGYCGPTNGPQCRYTLLENFKLLNLLTV